MALFRFSTDPPTRPLIRTSNLILRAPQATDYAAWAVLRMESREFLTPWEPVWNEDDLTRASFRLRVKRAAREIATDEAYSLFILDAQSDALLGGLTLGLVRRGVAQACTLGYWMGQRHAGSGHMTEAVRGALRFAFSDLAAAPGRGRLPAEQRAVTATARTGRLPARGRGAGLFAHQRPSGRPPALRHPLERPAVQRRRCWRAMIHSAPPLPCPRHERSVGLMVPQPYCCVPSFLSSCACPSSDRLLRAGLAVICLALRSR